MNFRMGRRESAQLLLLWLWGVLWGMLSHVAAHVLKTMAREAQLWGEWWFQVGRQRVTPNYWHENTRWRCRFTVEDRIGPAARSGLNGCWGGSSSENISLIFLMCWCSDVLMFSYSLTCEVNVWNDQKQLRNVGYLPGISAQLPTKIHLTCDGSFIWRPLSVCGKMPFRKCRIVNNSVQVLSLIWPIKTSFIVIVKCL